MSEEKDKLSSEENDALWGDFKRIIHFGNIPERKFNCRCVPIPMSGCQTCMTIKEHVLTEFKTLLEGNIMFNLPLKYCPQCGTELEHKGDDNEIKN